MCTLSVARFLRPAVPVWTFFERVETAYSDATFSITSTPSVLEKYFDPNRPPRQSVIPPPWIMQPGMHSGILGDSRNPWYGKVQLSSENGRPAAWIYSYVRTCAT